MKVYEKLNEIKGTDCTAETIADWFYDNRICPCTLDSFVPEVETKFKGWHKLADSVCREREVNCDLECCTNFVNKEMQNEN